MMGAVADGHEATAEVTPRMVFDELKVALMDRRRLELKRQGIDLDKHVYAPRPGDRARVYCHTHLEKCTVQGVAGKKDGDEEFFLDVAALRAVARELANEKPEWYLSSARTHGTHDQVASDTILTPHVTYHQVPGARRGSREDHRHAVSGRPHLPAD